MSLTKTRAWVAGTVLVSLVMVLAFWFLLINRNLAEADQLRTQVVAQQEENNTTRLRIEELKREYAKLPQHKAELESLQVAMPTTDRLNQLTRDLDKAALDANVLLESITPAEPLAVAQEGASGQGSGSGATGPVTPTTTQAGLVMIPVAIESDGTFDQQLRFIQNLQTALGRDFLVTGFEIGEPQPNPNETADELRARGETTMTITGNVYALPEDAATAATADQADASADSATDSADASTSD
ncbi:MAG: hypothetical protein ACK5MT_14955 [Actinomycetales bacterium]